MFPRLIPVKVSREENAFTLTASLRLDDKCLRLAAVKLFLESFDITRQEPCLWEEIICVGPIFLHGNQVLGEKIFSSQCIHSWEVISSLITVHFY